MDLEKDFSLFARDRGISSLALNDYGKFMSSYIEPTIVEERNLHATQISVFSRLFMERILFLGTEIDNMVANIINSQLLFLDMESNRPITMYINSPGGSVYDGLSIYDLFKYVSSPICTTCVGTAASMAAVLLSSGDKGSRFALPHSKVMIHQPSSAYGRIKAEDLAVEAAEMEKCKSTLYNILAENSGKSAEEVASLCSHDKWYSAEEALNEGFIDNVISKQK